MISIVIPVYNEEDNVQKLRQKIVDSFSGIPEPHEVIFVNDGSTDNTALKLKELLNTRVITLARRYGQTSALDAGIHAAKGAEIVTMDGDMQNDPADIFKLVAKLREGYDVVSGWRQDRRDSFNRRLLSRLANWLTAKVSGLYLHDSACALKAYRAKVVQSVNLYGEMHVFLPAYLHSRGARVVEMAVAHHERQHGVSKHYFMKAVKNLFDLVTIKFLVSMTGRPLVFFGGMGVFAIFLSFVVAAVAAYLKLADLRDFGQTPLPIFSVFLALSGIMLFMMGFIAELVLRVYFESKGQTPYIIKAESEAGVQNLVPPPPV